MFIIKMPNSSNFADDNLSWFFEKMPPIKRIASLTDDEINDLRLKVQNKSTTYSDKKWEKVFKAFLRENEMDEDFNAFDTETLNKWLSKLWFGAHQNKKEHTRFRANSLRSMHYTLNKCLQKYGKTYDITALPEFVTSQSAFLNAMMKELKSLFLFFFILDLFNLYHAPEMDPRNGPRALQAKVMFDITFYFARRDSESFKNMTTHTFKAVFDDMNDIIYIKKIEDELQKNHKECNDEIITGYMPKMKDNPLCPVESFREYMIHLNSVNSCGRHQSTT